MSKRRLVVTCSVLGLFIAVSFAAARLYMLSRAPLYESALYGGWFDTMTLIFWPSSFYLTVMVGKATVGRAIIVWSIAILFNAPIYGGVGWLIWRLSRLKLLRS
jgi:hypothetical protein